MLEKLAAGRLIVVGSEKEHHEIKITGQDWFILLGNQAFILPDKKGNLIVDTKNGRTVIPVVKKRGNR